MQSQKISSDVIVDHEHDGEFWTQPALQRVPGAARNVNVEQYRDRLRLRNRDGRNRDARELQLGAMLMTLLAGCLLLLIAGSAGAEDGASGKALHDRACTSCHGTEVYTRPDRKIDSLTALERQVQRCAEKAAKVDWNASQIDAVAQYLNNAFYGFDKTN
ncbi:MAG: hypothetical protein WAN46_19385 [Gammaproteobacteria bacterium]|jgi:mono/diheme cytochrome c family protein